jgi:hypothetical protein
MSIIDQLAIIEKSSLFLSPHTGFGFAAVAVGMPWLTISGGPLAGVILQRHALYSVLPDMERYPCFTQDGPPTPAIQQDDDGDGGARAEHERGAAAGTPARASHGSSAPLGAIARGSSRSTTFTDRTSDHDLQQRCAP